MANSAEELGKQALGNITPKSKEPTPEEALSRSQRKQKVAQVLQRGILNDKLERVGKENTPENWGWKLVYDDDEEILRHLNLGFVFEYRKGAKTDTADGRIRVGDLVLMTINPEDRALLKEVRADRVQEKLGAARQEYNRTANEKGAKGVAPFDESDTVVKKGTGR
jgi:hypothetical protein